MGVGISVVVGPGALDGSMDGVGVGTGNMLACITSGLWTIGCRAYQNGHSAKTIVMLRDLRAVGSLSHGQCAIIEEAILRCGCLRGTHLRWETVI